MRKPKSASSPSWNSTVTSELTAACRARWTFSRDGSMAILRAPRCAIVTQLGIVPKRPNSSTRLLRTSPQTRKSSSLLTEDPKEIARPSVTDHRASDMDESYGYLVAVWVSPLTCCEVTLESSTTNLHAGRSSTKSRSDALVKTLSVTLIRNSSVQLATSENRRRPSVPSARKSTLFSSPMSLDMVYPSTENV